MLAGFNDPVVKQMQVYWGGNLIDSPTFDTTGHTFLSPGWVTKNYVVTATGTSTPIEFVSLDNGAAGPMIDNVVVTIAPEPASLSLVGAASILLMVRRNRRSGRVA
jgi:hypothetical protein